MVKGWEKVDKHEVRARLSSPNADLPIILGTFQFKIIPDGWTDFSAPVGTDPTRSRSSRRGCAPSGRDSKLLDRRRLPRRDGALRNPRSGRTNQCVACGRRRRDQRRAAEVDRNHRGGARQGDLVRRVRCVHHHRRKARLGTVQRCAPHQGDAAPHGPGAPGQGGAQGPGWTRQRSSDRSILLRPLRRHSTAPARSGQGEVPPQAVRHRQLPGGDRRLRVGPATIEQATNLQRDAQKIGLDIESSGSRATGIGAPSGWWLRSASRAGTCARPPT